MKGIEPKTQSLIFDEVQDLEKLNQVYEALTKMNEAPFVPYTPNRAERRAAERKAGRRDK